MAKKKKIKIPKSVMELKLSPKKYAKKHGIKLKDKHMSKKDRKHSIKRLKNEYSESAINGLNKAVKILAENPEAKKIEKVKLGIDNIILNQFHNFRRTVCSVRNQQKLKPFFGNIPR